MAIEQVSDYSGGRNKTAPGVAPTTPEGLTPTPDKEVEALVNATDQNHREAIALGFLNRASRDLAQATLTRLRYVALAKRHGLTNALIGEALGVTEGAVRQMLKRRTDVD